MHATLVAKVTTQLKTVMTVSTLATEAELGEAMELAISEFCDVRIKA
jgi:hypothetical protein